MAAPDLTTRNDLKAWLQITGTTDDALLDLLITSISEWIQVWLSFRVWVTSYSDKLNGNGGAVLYLPNPFLVAVTSVKIDGAAIPLSAGPDAAGYYLVGEGQNLSGIGLRNYRFTRGFSNVEVTYTAGIATDANSVPHDLQRCCLEMCAMKYKERDRIGLVSKGLGGETTTFFMKDMPDTVATALANWQKVVPL